MSMLNAIIEAQAEYASRVGFDADMIYLSPGASKKLKAEVNELLGPLIAITQGPMSANPTVLGLAIKVDPIASDGEFALAQMRPMLVSHYPLV
jgi:hypothetical protein